MTEVRVVKSYDNGQEIYGTLEVEDIEQFRKDMQARKVQTVDSRIEWDEEPAEGAEYEDFSFAIVED